MTHIRRWIWRLGRKLYCWARRDGSNNPQTSGEYWLLGELVRVCAPQSHVIDVGANKGEWSLRALSLAHFAGKILNVHAIEPCSGTRSILERNLALVAGGKAEVFAYALSSVEGEADFFSSGAGAGTNSLNAVSGPSSERVRVITLDHFVEQQCIDRIAMLKVDTEGFDCGVLQGARRMLAEGRIDLVQFEYNWRWLLNKVSLLDVFDLIRGMPYRLGKVSGSSIEYYEAWHFELDRFFENNYVLVLIGSPLEHLGYTVRFDDTNAPQIVE